MDSAVDSGSVCKDMAFFSRLPWQRKAAFSDGVLDLLPLDLAPPDPGLGIEETYVFQIAPYGTRRDAGQITLRVGESRGIYYFGHIGYHVNAPYRGNHFAFRACQMLIPLMQALKMRSLVITADPDNLPSRRTCEALGAVLECVAPVPQDFRRKYGLGAEKCRYVYRIPSRGA